MHGWGGSITSFKNLADRLKNEFSVTLVDLYGFGATPHPDRPLSLDDYANGVIDIIEESCGDDVILIGHSFGGRVAMRVAARCDRVAALVLIDSAGVPPRRGIKYHARVLNYKIKKKLGLRTSNAGSDDYAKLSGAMKGTFVRIVNESNLPDCEKITVPVLLLWGSEDKDTPLYMCKKLKTRLLGAEAVVIKGAGHFSYLEKPEFSRRVIRAFLKGL